MTAASPPKDVFTAIGSQEQCQLVALSVELPSPMWLRPVLALALALKLVPVQELRLLHHYRSHQQLSSHTYSKVLLDISAT